ncbi:unnamed protein product, partial [Laminaria digitata]
AAAAEAKAVAAAVTVTTRVDRQAVSGSAATSTSRPFRGTRQPVLLPRAQGDEPPSVTSAGDEEMRKWGKSPPPQSPPPPSPPPSSLLRLPPPPSVLPPESCVGFEKAEPDSGVSAAVPANREQQVERSPRSAEVEANESSGGKHPSPVAAAPGAGHTGAGPAVAAAAIAFDGRSPMDEHGQGVAHTVASASDKRTREAEGDTRTAAAAAAVAAARTTAAKAAAEALTEAVTTTPAEESSVVPAPRPKRARSLQSLPTTPPPLPAAVAATGVTPE